MVEAVCGEQLISVAEFISVAIFLAEESGKVIRQVAESGDLKTQQKGGDGPVTIADITVQKTIEQNLKYLYPDLNIQGEESKESTASVQSAVHHDALSENLKRFVSQTFLNEHHTKRLDFINQQLRKTYGVDEISSDFFETFSTKDAVVWVDPLDGTTDFVNGNWTAVTVLIGLSLNEKSRIGIVHKPFADEDQSKGVTVFGSGEFGVFQLPYEKGMTSDQLLSREIHYLEPYDHEKVPSDDHQVKVGASLTHFSGSLKEIIERVAPVDIVRMGGAGNKCLAIATGKTESYMHPNPGLKYWDLCANESLIKGMGGYSTNLFAERLTYPLSGNRNIRGLILAHNPPMYHLIMRRLGDSWVEILKNVKL